MLSSKRPASPHHLPDMSHEHAAWNWFYEEVIRSQIQNARDHPWIIDRRQDQNGGVAEHPNFAAHLPAIHIRHHQVQKDYVWGFFFGQSYTIRTAIGCNRLEAMRLEKH